MSNEFRQVDLMIGDVRRRRWTTERKLQIIEESYGPGETVSSAARFAANSRFNACSSLSLPTNFKPASA